MEAREVRKWFRVGTKTQFISAPDGDRWIAKNVNGEVGTFSDDGDTPHDIVIPSGTDWHPVRDAEVVKTLSELDSLTAIRRIQF